MPNKRKEILTNGEIYHVYNRSVGNIDIFLGVRGHERFLNLIDYYRYPQNISFTKYKELNKENLDIYQNNYRKNIPNVELYCFIIMPNHFHFLLKQVSDNGIRNYISNLQNGYAKYFNIKHQRSGSLFQTPFKAKRIGEDNLLLHISRYIHLNPVTSFLIEFDQMKTYPWSSFQYYLSKSDQDIINERFILDIAGSRNNYKKFVEDQEDYQKKLHLIKSQTLEA